jgi:hypothetical protein
MSHVIDFQILRVSRLCGSAVFERQRASSGEPKEHSIGDGKDDCRSRDG